MFVRACGRVGVWVGGLVCICVYTYIHTYIHTYICIYMHTGDTDGGRSLECGGAEQGHGALCVPRL
jgi:hypothetical protein